MSFHWVLKFLELGFQFGFLCGSDSHFEDSTCLWLENGLFSTLQLKGNIMFNTIPWSCNAEHYLLF